MLKTLSVNFSYNPNKQFTFPDFDLADGDDMLILGESGIGKTTLLHLLAGLLKPSSGKIEIDGVLLNDLSPGKADQFRGENIGLIFQRPHFIHSLSIKKNMGLIQYLGRTAQDKKRLTEIAENLGIISLLDKLPHRLSQGEQQRAAIALALLNRPKLILADEPTSSLDDRNCAKVCGLLKEQAKATNAKMVIITHDHRLKKEFENVVSL